MVLAGQSQTYLFLCSEADEGRLDRFLLKCLPHYSRARLQALIADGRVSVDGIPAHKSGQSVSRGSSVQIVFPPSLPSAAAEDIPLDVIFENGEVMVINKPAGMVVHPAAGHRTGTLVNAALGHAPDMQGIGGEERPGIVHRLDRDTSGLIVLAKNDAAHQWLQDQFRLRRVEKAYVALVDGRPPTSVGRIEAAIGRDPAHRKRMAVVPDSRGREALTEYRVLESFPHHTLLECRPLTGRTHQIRLHCAFLGCPIVGDTVYGRKPASLSIGRQFLHATRLRVLLPGETSPRTFEAPLPAELEHVLEAVRRLSGLSAR